MFKKYIIFPVLILMTIACRTLTFKPETTPPPELAVDLGKEFTLAPGQIATLAASNLTVQLVGVSNDGRCPKEIECAASLPVYFSLKVQKDGAEPATFDLQTFTDQDGIAPQMEFEGIQNRAEYEDYLIQVVSVLPYPLTREDKIDPGDYRVTLVVNGIVK